MISSSKPAAVFLLMAAAVLSLTVAPAVRGADRDGPRGRTLLSGRIRSIDPDDRTFALDSDRGWVTVQARDASIVARGARRASGDYGFRDLRRGERVEVEGSRVRDDRFRADIVRRLDIDGDRDGYTSGRDEGRPGLPYTGTIDRIDRGRRTFRLRTGGGDYEVDARDADLVGYERGRRFGDLENGELARVYGERRGRRLVADRISPGGFLGLDPGRDRVGAGPRLTVGGVVEDLDRRSRTFRLRTGQAPVRVRLLPDAVVRDERGRVMALRDLREGDRIRIFGTQRDTSGYFNAERLEVAPD